MVNMQFISDMLLPVAILLINKQVYFFEKKREVFSNNEAAVQVVLAMFTPENSIAICTKYQPVKITLRILSNIPKCRTRKNK